MILKYILSFFSLKEKSQAITNSSIGQNTIMKRNYRSAIINVSLEEERKKKYIHDIET